MGERSTIDRSATDRSATDRSTMGDVDHTPRNADVNDVWVRGPDGAVGTEHTDE